MRLLSLSMHQYLIKLPAFCLITLWRKANLLRLLEFSEVFFFFFFCSVIDLSKQSMQSLKPPSSGNVIKSF